MCLDPDSPGYDAPGGRAFHDRTVAISQNMGRLELARTDCDSEYLDDVADVLDRSEELIDELLALSPEGKAVDDAKPVDLDRLAADCWEAVATNDASLVAATDWTVRADRSRLRQLLENLFRNAVEHGGMDVRITVGDRADGFYVADDGSDIPLDERGDVFESGYSMSPDGTGFGLAVVQEIARVHGWEVRASEAEDGGARFDVTGVDPTGGK